MNKKRDFVTWIDKNYDEHNNQYFTLSDITLNVSPLRVVKDLRYLIFE
jgi:hypothetical protein